MFHVTKFLATAVIVSSLAAFTPTALAEEASVPATAEEHQAMASLYRDKAATFRKEADWHKQMVAAYKSARGSKGQKANNPAAIKKMEMHCAALAKTAAKLATDAEKVAELHERQAEAAKTN